MKVAQSCPTLCDPMDYTVHGILHARILEWKPFPSPGDLPNQGLNPGLPHCRWILYLLSHKGSPRILELVAYPFFSRSAQPRNQTRVSHITGGFLPTELSGKPQLISTDDNIYRERSGVSRTTHYLWSWYPEERKASKQHAAQRFQQ